MLASPLLRSMRTRSPVLRSASPPPAAASGEALRIEGEPDVPDWRPSPMQGSAVDAAFDQGRRRLHVDHLGAAGIADRPGAADEQHAVLVDLRGRIVDAVVIVLRPVEHDRPALEGVRGFRIGQIAVAELLRDHAGLHDRGIEQVALQHDEAGVLDQRIVERADDVGIVRLAAPRQLSPIVLPLTVSAFSWIRPFFISSLTTAGTPPAR